MRGGPDGNGPKKPKPYNPLEKRRLAESIVRELLESESELLPPRDKFLGAGIYVIYYRGSFELYRALADLNKESLSHPIYVGRAVPKGGRIGGFAEATTSDALLKRLGEHASSIRQARNLDIADFHCRYLVVDEFWISLAESLLIESYRPLWNVVLSGFGNHHVGGARMTGKRTAWDTLHPGRKWAEGQQNPGSTLDAIKQQVKSYLLELPQP